MGYVNRKSNSIDDVDLAAWERLRHDAKASPFTDPRFVGAVEASMTANYRSYTSSFMNAAADPWRSPA